MVDEPNNIVSTKSSTNGNYFNLIENKIADLTIEVDKTSFNCLIVDKKTNEIYGGFILAKSPTKKAITICEVDFHESKDHKYQPRLTFKRTDEAFIEKKVNGDSVTQRITFQQSGDGYKEFWEMIAFLKGFRDIVDTGTFEKEYKVLKQEEVTEFLNKKNNNETEEVVNQLGIDSATAFQYLTTIKLLKHYKEKLEEFINKSSTETDVQNWIDEEEHIHRKDRCMIFGLEFIDHKREGGTNGNRYDLFTKIGLNSEERVLIELKSPSDTVFEIKETKTINGIKKEYSLSSSLSRAIPQILEYREDLEDKKSGDPELQKIEEENPIKIAKCIVVIGHSVDDTRWKKCLLELRRSLASNLEIWTYSDLLEKVNCTIKNLSDRNN